MLKDLFRLIYPNLCPACEEPLPKGESMICPACFENLPRTDFHLRKDNLAEKIFYGRFDFQNVSSAFHFSKGNSVQRVLHEIKYNGGTDLAEQLAAWYGKNLAEKGWFREPPIFIPVPLHSQKMYKRGYNQAFYLAKGLASAVKDSLYMDFLLRREDKGSQTRKSRFARWENVENIFIPAHDEILTRPVVLVDDVLTTGATLEACATALKPVTQEKISALTLAFAGRL
jgi:ComF family protein